MHHFLVMRWPEEMPILISASAIFLWEEEQVASFPIIGSAIQGAAMELYENREHLMI